MSPKKLPVLVSDGDALYKYATIDWLDAGKGILIHNKDTQMKLSRHQDGNIYNRIPGSGGSSHSTSVLFSDITHEVISRVPIPPDFLANRSTWSHGPSTNALTFSSTVLASEGYFVAEIVDDSQAQRILDAYSAHSDFLSAQRVQAHSGKTLIVSILNKRSTGHE